MNAYQMATDWQGIPIPIDLMQVIADLAELSPSREPSSGQPSGTQDLDRYLYNVARLSKVSDELGYAALGRACLIVREAIEALRRREAPLSLQALRTLDTWVCLMRWHLELPPGAGATEALVNFLRLPPWDASLDHVDAEAFAARLTQERRQTAVEEGHGAAPRQ